MGSRCRAEILLVEDNPSDVRLTVEAMTEGGIDSNLRVVRDGEEALLFLRREGSYADAPRPDLILLDLNLPRKDGREVLREIKQVDGLRRIPVVILSTSCAEEDIERTYELHANSFITKPADLDRFIQVVQQISRYWFGIARLPGRSDVT